METLANLVVIDLQYMYMEIIKLYTLNLHSVIGQLYLYKAGKNK